MKYFFTRKLMLIKESSAFVCLPGRLRHAGRDLRAAHPPPDRQGDARRRSCCSTCPGGTYWTHWVEYVDRELVAKGLVSPEDHELFLVTDDVDAAVADIQRFWHSYHSIRWVGDRLVIRLRHAPTAGGGRRPQRALRRPPARRHHRGRPTRCPAEVADRDELELPRLVMRYDARRAGRLRGLIDALNDLPSAAHLSADV